MSWLQPFAWWGLAALIVPFTIHLLARRRTRRVLFPSLRFLPAAHSAALRHRVVSDWRLLAVRLLIVVAATAALAGPIVVSEARRERWGARSARAVVVGEAGALTDPALASDEARGVFRFAQFQSASLADGIRDAVDWFARQPPSSREIVIAADLREGTLSDSDLALVPPFVGIRLLPLTSRLEASVEQTGFADSPDAGAVAQEVRVVAGSERTDVTYRRSDALPSTVRVVGTAAEQASAEAILRAVLREGLWLNAQRRITIAYKGAAVDGMDRFQLPSAAWMQAALSSGPEVRGGDLDGALLVRIDVPATDPRAVDISAHVLRGALAVSFDRLEPRRIPASVVAAWSRPPGAPPADAPPADEGDRRWLWGAVLALLIIEHALRRGRQVDERHEPRTSTATEDARVA